MFRDLLMRNSIKLNWRLKRLKDDNVMTCQCHALVYIDCKFQEVIAHIIREDCLEIVI